MGAQSSKSKLVKPQRLTNKCAACKSKKRVRNQSDNQAVIKEVYILFLILDYMPFPDLIRLSQLSRGLYWLTGNQLLLFKFQSYKPT